MRRSSKTFLYLSLAVAGLILLGCGDDGEGTTQPQPDAPPLPPTVSLSGGYGAFPSDSAGKSLAPAVDPVGQNFLAAALAVASAQAVTAALLVPPASAFALAVSVTPAYQPKEATFLWDYNWTYEGTGDNVNIRLTAELEVDHVNWELRVSGSLGQFEMAETLWYSGTSSYDATEGSWLVYNILDAALPEMMTVEWSYTSSTDWTTDLTNVLAGSDGEGDRLVYSLDGTTAKVTYVDAPAGIQSYVTWDTDTLAGSLRLPGYNDGQEACWDEDLQDVACPPTL